MGRRLAGPVWVSVNQVCLSRSKKSTFEGPRGGQWLCLAHSQKSQAARGSCATSQLPAPGWTRGEKGGKWKDRWGIWVLSEWPILINAYSAAPLMMLIGHWSRGQDHMTAISTLTHTAQQPCRWKAREKSVNTPQSSKIICDRAEVVVQKMATKTVKSVRGQTR